MAIERTGPLHALVLCLRSAVAVVCGAVAGMIQFLLASFLAAIVMGLAFGKESVREGGAAAAMFGLLTLVLWWAMGTAGRWAAATSLGRIRATEDLVGPLAIIRPVVALGKADWRFPPRRQGLVTGTVAGVALLALLACVFTSAKRDDPASSGTAKRLTTLAVLLIGVGIAARSGWKQGGTPPDEIADLAKPRLGAALPPELPLDSAVSLDERTEEHLTSLLQATNALHELLSPPFDLLKVIVGWRWVDADDLHTHLADARASMDAIDHPELCLADLREAMDYVDDGIRRARLRWRGQVCLRPLELSARLSAATASLVGEVLPSAMVSVPESERAQVTAMLESIGDGLPERSQDTWTSRLTSGAFAIAMGVVIFAVVHAQKHLAERLPEGSTVRAVGIIGLVVAVPLVALLGVVVIAATTGRTELAIGLFGGWGASVRWLPKRQRAEHCRRWRRVLYVDGIEPDSIAERSGLLPGDCIAAYCGMPLDRAFRDLSAMRGKSPTMTVMRGGLQVEVVLRVVESEEPPSETMVP